MSRNVRVLINQGKSTFIRTLRAEDTSTRPVFAEQCKGCGFMTADPMLKHRIAALKAIRDQVRADAERAAGALDRLGPSITPRNWANCGLSRDENA